MSNVDTFLEHYGRKGMRWGIRRRRESKITKTSPRPSDEGRDAAKILSKQKKFGTAALTNHELRVINARAKLEKEFKTNFPKPKSTLQKGEDAAKRIIVVAGTAEAAYKIFNGPVGQAIIKRGKKVVPVATP